MKLTRPTGIGCDDLFTCKMQPELEIKCKPIDVELADLLGRGTSDFLVICFDGVQLEDFGTPYDTPANRANRQTLVDMLNDGTLWPKMFNEWKATICRQFNLPETTTHKDYKPVVSYKVSRVCAGYSEYLHAAIQLFEDCADKIERWELKQGADCRASIVDKRGATYLNIRKTMAEAIAATMLEMLKAHQVNGKAHA